MSTKNPQLVRLTDKRVYPIHSSEVTIGRRETCDLSLGDESGVSRDHARIELKEGCLLYTSPSPRDRG